MKEKIYLANIKINGNKQLPFLVGGKNKIKVKKYIISLYTKLKIITNRKEINVKLEEVYYDGYNYISKRKD